MVDEPRTILFASDHAGVTLRRLLAAHATELGHAVSQFGPAEENERADYPDVANAALARMHALPGTVCVLICGSGIGMSIAANRQAGIRAALVSDGLSAALSRRHNDANVLCLGARLIGPETAIDCLERFLATPFEGGRHEARVKKLG